MIVNNIITVGIFHCFGRYSLNSVCMYNDNANVLEVASVLNSVLVISNWAESYSE